MGGLISITKSEINNPEHMYKIYITSQVNLFLNGIYKYKKIF